MTELVILNSRECQHPSPPPPNLMDRLHDAMLKLKADFVTEEGVRYESMQTSLCFQQYLELTTHLRTLDVTRDEAIRKAFFLNLYNCLTLHALIAAAAEGSNLPKKPTDVAGLWTRFAYDVGGHSLTLDDIEHGILRCNRSHPSRPLEKQFWPIGDSRESLSLEKFDCRVHFALNCGAKSCPAIRVYQAVRLDSQLEAAARTFCASEVNVDGDEVRLSQIFRWYRADFGSSDEEVKATVANFLEDGTDNKKIMKPGTKIVYDVYDWKINSA